MTNERLVQALLHHIPRAEWVRRFKDHIARRLGTPAHEIAEAELENWPEQDEHPSEGFPPDWMTSTPEDAADEYFSNWIEAGTAHVH